jgi:high-affinity Fe2+/Pb2+ permease
MLLLPLGLKLLVKRLFGKDVSYLVSFLIVLAVSMVLSGIVSHFDRPVR